MSLNVTAEKIAAELEALAAKHAAERKELETAAALLPLLPASIGAPYMMHGNSKHTLHAPHDLRVTYAPSYGQPTPTWETVAALAAAFPAVDLLSVKKAGWAASITTAAFWEAMPEAEKDKYESETELASFWAEFQPQHNRRLSVEWYAATPAGLVCFEVELPGLPREFATFHARRVDVRGGFKWEGVQLGGIEEAHTLFAADDEPVAQLNSPTRWGSGQADSLPTYGFTWCNIGTKQKATAADLARAMIAARDKIAAKV